MEKQRNILEQIFGPSEILEEIVGDPTDVYDMIDNSSEEEE